MLADPDTLVPPDVTLVSVDFGKWTSGIAVWAWQDLIAATELHIPRGTPDPAIRMARGLYDYASMYGADRSVTRWVGEKMVDRETKGARREDLESLREVARALKVWRVKLTLLRAEEWKGQVPKAVCFRRIEAALTEEEKTRVARWGKESLDAIGQGMVRTGRLLRGCVRP